MVLTSIMIVTRRMISFTFTYGKKWWISTGVFLIGYLLAIKYMYPRILFDGESILTFLFQGPYPIHNYTDYLLPYLCFCFICSHCYLSFSRLLNYWKHKVFFY
ncbi:Uncharacterised protein [Enterococcus mundtii]|nr:Uncharacterised protein [Enterococcus mundtii]